MQVNYNKLCLTSPLGSTAVILCVHKGRQRHCVAQVNLKLIILLPLLPELWDGVAHGTKYPPFHLSLQQPHEAPFTPSHTVPSHTLILGVLSLLIGSTF